MRQLGVRLVVLRAALAAGRREQEDGVVDLVRALAQVRSSDDRYNIPMTRSD